MINKYRNTFTLFCQQCNKMLIIYVLGGPPKLHKLKIFARARFQLAYIWKQKNHHHAPIQYNIFKNHDVFAYWRHIKAFYFFIMKLCCIDYLPLNLFENWDEFVPFTFICKIHDIIFKKAKFPYILFVKLASTISKFQPNTLKKINYNLFSLFRKF